MGKGKRKRESIKIVVNPTISPNISPEMSQSYNPSTSLAPAFDAHSNVSLDVVKDALRGLLEENAREALAAEYETRLAEERRRAEEAEARAREAEKSGYDRAHRELDEQYRSQIAELQSQIKGKQGEPLHGPLENRIAIRLYNLAVDLTDAGKLEEAITFYSMAIDHKPDYLAAYANRAYLRFCINDHAGAIDDLTRCIELDPNNAAYFINRSHAKCRASNYSGAEDDARQAIVLTPRDWYSYSALGGAHIGYERFEDARRDFTKAISLAPGEAQNYLNRGTTFYRMRCYQEALADYDRAIKLAPNEPIAYNNRAMVEESLASFDLAVTDYHQAVALKPNYYEARVNLINLLYDLNRYEESIGMSELLIAQYPDASAGLIGRARARFELGDADGAFADLRKALEVEPDSAGVHYDLAVLLAKKGLRVEAETNLLRALALDSQYVELAGRDKAFLILRDSADLRNAIPHEFWFSPEATEDNPRIEHWSIAEND